MSDLLLPHTAHFIFFAMSLLGLGFLVWFLVALIQEDRETRTRQGAHHRWPSGEAMPIASFLPTRRKGPQEKYRKEKKAQRRVRSCAEIHPAKTPSGNGPPRSELHVFRLEDRQINGNKTKLRWLVMMLLLSAAFRLPAQTADSPPKVDQQSSQSQTPAEPNSAGRSTSSATPLPTPSMTGPLQAAPPIEIDAGPLGKLALNGVVSGIGLWQGNHVAGDEVAQAALSNGQVFVQKTTRWWQFYVQAGAYNILALGTPFLPTDKAINELYGPVPVAFVKLVPGKNTSILVGALPTLMGAEYTFDFENMNIERGLLWNQENAVTRGIQVNQSLGRVTASISWNDGYYSNRYSWLSGSLTYAKGPSSLSFVAMGNLGQTPWQTLRTPIQNNGSMYAVIYSYTKGSWIIQPYFQYGSVPQNPQVGVMAGASTSGGALLLNHSWNGGFSLSGRGEYIASTGSTAQNSVSLLYGPGSAAWSITVTPTFERSRFFVRGDLSFVRASSFSLGDAFGTAGHRGNQPRAVIEIGLLF
jgi:hypothetical protein